MAFTTFFDFDCKELRTERFSLLSDCSTSIENADNSAQVLGSTDGGKTGDTTADDQNLGRGDTAGL